MAYVPVLSIDADDGWNNYLYDTRTRTLNPEIDNFFVNELNADTAELALDDSAPEREGWRNFVGYGDDTDFATITLEGAAKLSFTVSSTDAATFAVSRLESKTDAKGNTTYTVKSLQSTSVKANATVTTKELMLEAGEYFVSMVSTTAARGGAAYYNVELAPSTVFFTDGDDGRNNYLYDAKTKTLNPELDNFVVTPIDGATAELALDADAPEREGWRNFVGYGDAADYAVITLDDAAKLSFTVSATDAATFAISRLESKTDAKGNTTYTVKSLQSTAVKANATVTTKDLMLEAGEYYISMTSTTAAKGGAAYYNVELGPSTAFFSDGDDGWNNYVYDTKAKTLNPELDGFVVTPIDGATAELTLDAVAPAREGWQNFVGYGDDTDYAVITLDDAARLSFTVSSTDAANFAVSRLESKTDAKGNTTYTVKALQSTAVKANATVTTKDLMLEAGEYYISMQSTNAAKGGAAYYNVELGASTVFFVDGDDGWNNYVYDAKTKTLNPELDNFVVTPIDGATGELLLDDSAPEREGWRNFVGYGDDTDYAVITLDDAARVSFTVSSTDAANFAVSRLESKTDAKGNTTYTVKSLQSTSVKADTTVTTKDLMLEAGEYYISMTSTNAAKGGGAYYNVELGPSTVFFTDGDDGWNNYLYDTKAKAFNPEIDNFVVTEIAPGTEEVALDDNAPAREGWRNFVGYGDDTDYAVITLEDAAKLSFTVSSTDAANFTISRIESKTDAKGNTTYSVKSLQSTAVKANVTVATKDLMLEAGEYYISMQSTTAAKGGGAYYNVELAESTVFFMDGDDGWNNYLYDTKAKVFNPEIDNFVVTEIAPGTEEVALDDDAPQRDGWRNFVGYGDDADYAVITLEDAAKLSFTVSSTDAANFAVSRIESKTDAKGNTTYSVKSLQSTSVKANATVTTKELMLEAGEYYVSMQSTNAAKGGAAYYNVELSEKSVFFSDGDDGRNNYLYDTKTKTLNPEIGGFVANEINGSTVEVALDDSAPEREGWRNFVGYGDDTDYAVITLENAARLSFTVSSTDAANFAISSLESKTDAKGNTTYNVKSLQSTSVKANTTVATKDIMLEAGEYYVSMQSTNAAKGGAAYYNVELGASSVFFSDGDDGWNNYLYDNATKTVNPEFEGFVSNDITADTEYLELDADAPEREGWRNFVGYGDDTDFALIRLENSAKVCFDVSSTDSATFAVSRLEAKTDANDNTTYTVKSLQSTSVKANTAVTTKELMLEAGDYYISMTSTNAAQGGGAYYNVGVNQSRTEFYENLFTGYSADPEVEQLPGGTDIVISWTPAEAENQRQVSYFVSIDGGAEIKATGSSYTAPNLSMTDHVVGVRAKDQYGNSSDVSECWFNIEDIAAPTVSSLTVDTRYNLAEVTVSASDNIGITSYIIAVDDDERYLSAEEYDAAGGVIFTRLDYGKHTASVRAEDAAGNQSAVLTKEFTLSMPGGTVSFANADVSDIGYCGGDFYDEVAAGQTLVYRFSTDDANGFLEFRLENDATAKPTFTIYREVDEERSLAVKIDTVAGNSGSYRDEDDGKNWSYQLKAADFDPDTNYYLSVKAGGAGEVRGSVWEISGDIENNSFETATEVYRDEDHWEFPEAGLFAGDKVDYYRFFIEDSGVYKFGGIAEFGNAGATVYNDYFDRVTSVNLSKNETYGQTFFLAGEYYLKVDLSGTRSSYLFDVQKLA